MNSEVELLNKIRENFLLEHTKQEMQIAQWAEKLSKVDPFILKDVKLPDEISLRTFMPELYSISDRICINQYDTNNSLSDRSDYKAQVYFSGSGKLYFNFNGYHDIWG